MKGRSLILIAIFILSIAVRLMFSLNSPYFNDDYSYFALRQIENIKEHALPLYEDYLSYSGRTYVFSPVYYYILAFFSFIIPNALKIIPNVLASTIVIIVYYISMLITRNKYISLFSAAVSVFIPIYLKVTYNTLNLITFIVPLSFLLIYLLLSRKSYLFSIGLIILAVSSPYSLVLILGSLIYLLLCKLTGIKIDRTETEAIIFSIFFSVWILLILYKNALLKHGVSLIWQNLPQSLLATHFSQFSIPEAIYQVGFFLFLCGLYVLYRNIFTDKDRKIYFFFGFAIAIITLLWFKLIAFSVGLMFLGIVLVILFSYFIYTLYLFTRRIHLTKYNLLITILIIGFIIFGSVIPSFIELYLSSQHGINKDDIVAFKWINENTEPNAVILAPPIQGHMLSYYAKRRNVMDTNFILVDEVDDKFNSVSEIYKTAFRNSAIRLINKYKIDYIAVTEVAKKVYGIEDLRYVDNECFKRVYEHGNVSVYKSLCALEER